MCGWTCRCRSARGEPHRDLLLIANHGVIVDGLVIDAGALVNGTTVSHVPKSQLPPTVTYGHIKTSDPDVILAEGPETETFVDDVGRKAFANYDEYVALYGHEEVIAELPKSRIFTRRLVPGSIRARLAARGNALDRATRHQSRFGMGMAGENRPPSFAWGLRRRWTLPRWARGRATSPRKTGARRA